MVANNVNTETYYSSGRNSQRPSSAREIVTTKKEYHHDRLIKFEFRLGKKILESWTTKDTEEHNSRKMTTIVLTWILVVQLVVVNLIVIFTGLGKLEFSDSMIKTFITGTFVELTALLGVIFAYLFKERKVEPLRVALEAFENINKHNAKYYAESSGNSLVDAEEYDIYTDDEEDEDDE